MTVKGLLKARDNRQHVTGLPWGHATAAFVCNMNWNFVTNVLPRLKIYKPKRK